VIDAGQDVADRGVGCIRPIRRGICSAPSEPTLSTTTSELCPASPRSKAAVVADLR